jgi:hypothetical protein
MSIHIPDVIRAYSNLYIVTGQLRRAIAEIRKTIIENNMPRDVAHEVFFQTQTDQAIQGRLMELSIYIEDATKLLEEINFSSVKRGRKFIHWERMLTEKMAKADKDYGKYLKKYGHSWTDVPE